MLDLKKALVLFSGGQDSTTLLYWALQRFHEVHTLTINYHQRHFLELKSAVKIINMARPTSYDVIDLPEGVLRSTASLVDMSQPVEEFKSVNDLPTTIDQAFIPCRNVLFLALAGNRAMAHNCGTILIGLAKADYAAAPDCREPFVMAMRQALKESATPLADSLQIDAPFISFSKKEIVLLGVDIPGCMDALAYSHSCWHGHYPPNPTNHASILRAQGFHEAGVADPLIVRAQEEELLPLDYPKDGFVEGTAYAYRGSK